ncbi:type IX secretion system sortase PorU [Saccharicrinis sp. 156]|uniref:type IX secretion system sortase PorU n=1 Tax=Saccharicrinis sp. 156 TaxID=3417574 RepID=UPI003D33818F
MRFKKIGLWGLLGVLSMALNGQINEKHENTVEWSEPVTIDQHGEQITLLQFSDMGDINPETEIPALSKSIKLATAGKPEDIIVQISNMEFVWPTPKEHVLFVDKVRQEQVDFQYSISQSGNNYFVDFTLDPLIKPADAQTFKKLVSYTINIAYNKQEKKSLKSALESDNYAQNSVLNSGDWVKVSVEKTGIHKISYSKLADWGISNPQNVGIYGNGGRMIPADNSAFRNDDLVENAIWHYNNAIYFFAEGPVVWDYNTSAGMFIHEKHRYSNFSYYFITEKNASSLIVQESDLQSDSYNQEVDYFQDYEYHEEDNLNLLKSGNVWYGEKFDYYAQQSHSFDFNFDNVRTASKAKAYAKLAARSGVSTSYAMSANGETIDRVDIYNINTSSHTSYYAREGFLKGEFTNTLNSINLLIDFELDETSASAIGYLDYLCLNVERELSFVEDELLFRNIDVVYDGNTVKYNIGNSQGVELWDVTNPLVPLKISLLSSGTSSSFNYEADDLKQFVAFDPTGNFPSPEFEANVANQDLHASDFVDYVIVSHVDFVSEANRLGQIHNDYNGTTYLVVTSEQIYNEFSSGKPDVTAIRSFVKMLYDRAGEDNSDKPKNLLLFGDGSYDNRQGIANNTDKILTYQSDNSIHNTNSYVTDDYMGLLDDGEGDNITSDKLDIGIGRFPVNTIEEAKNAVDKTYKYYYEQANDQWKSDLTFVGDDGDNNIHMDDANGLTIKLAKSHPEYNISKFYFDNYEKVTTISGHSIPEIEEDIANAIDEGTLVFNYTGHGGTSVLAHERIITKEHISTWNNIDKLALFVTATCEFSRYDDKDYTSAGEEVFLNPLGGGIALYTTTRIVYSSLNKALNTSFYNFAFERDDDGKPYTLGEIMMHTKNGLSASVNKLNFSLLGDPAIRLIYPELGTRTLKINDKMVEGAESGPIDTIKALSAISLMGEVVDLSDTSRVDFDGEIFVSVFDKQTQITTRGNDGAEPFQYETFDNVIFKGPASVNNGEFKLEFVVPKDIRYNFDNGKISYYAFSDESTQQAFGAFSDVIVGGIDNSAEEDNEGPQINLWLNNKSFSSGDKVGNNPVLLAEILDASGINTTGSGIGHDITCVIDGVQSNPIILNDNFEAAIDNYKHGYLNYQLSSLVEGSHSLTLKVWDTHNNSSTSSINFMVSSDGALAVSDPVVFPNPVKQGIESYLSFNHDDPNSRLEVQIMFFNLAGQLVSQQNSSVISLIDSVPPIEMKAETSDGAALDPGVYLYKVVVYSQTGRKGVVSGKFMVAQ